MTDYISSAEDFKSFMDSSIWRDMKGEIELWIEQIRNSLETPESSEDDESDDSLRGSAKALRRVLAMPEVIRGTILEDRDDSRHVKA